MRLNYAYKSESEGFVARATGKDLRIKFKHAVEICAAIQGMKVDDAVKYLQDVMDGKKYIPFKKTKRHGGHKKGIDKWPYGQQPVKATKEVLYVLKSVRSNAEFRGLDIGNCTVVSALALKGRNMLRMKPRGRQALYKIPLTSVQITIEEVSE
jgi:large subunit ribosomal protein L22